MTYKFLIHFRFKNIHKFKFTKSDRENGLILTIESFTHLAKVFIILGISLADSYRITKSLPLSFPEFIQKHLSQAVCHKL